MAISGLRIEDEGKKGQRVESEVNLQLASTFVASDKALWGWEESRVEQQVAESSWMHAESRFILRIWKHSSEFPTSQARSIELLAGTVVVCCSLISHLGYLTSPLSPCTCHRASQWAPGRLLPLTKVILQSALNW